MSEETRDPLDDIRSYILVTNLLLIAYPIYKMFKKNLRCYYTPFLFVFGGATECFLLFGEFAFSSTRELNIFYVTWIFVCLSPIVSIVIIFGDSEFSKKTKIKILCIFLAIEILFFLSPLVIKDKSKYLFYICITIYSLGPIECFIWCLKLKDERILPIFSSVLLLGYDIVPFITYRSRFNYLIFILFVGCASCFAQLLTYFLLFSARKYQESSQTEHLSKQVDNISPDSLYEP